MTVQTRFMLPTSDADRTVREVALTALNAIKLNEDHIRHGFGFLIAADFETEGTAANRLLAFASAEGFYPVDLAAHAISIRAGWLHAYIAAGEDPELNWAYEQFASAPITLQDIGCPEGPEDDEEPLDDEIPW